jgi:hypothetical protein
MTSTTPGHEAPSRELDALAREYVNRFLLEPAPDHEIAGGACGPSTRCACWGRSWCWTVSRCATWRRRDHLFYVAGFTLAAASGATAS